MTTTSSIPFVSPKSGAHSTRIRTSDFSTTLMWLFATGSRRCSLKHSRRGIGFGFHRGAGRDQIVRESGPKGRDNGSSTVVRRSLLEPSLDEIRDIRKGVPPYLFYRAWCSSAAIVVDSRPLTAVRLHSENTTPTRFQGRRARFARLALIAPDLSADAETILAVVGPGVWDIPLRQMSSMGVIL